MKKIMKKSKYLIITLFIVSIMVVVLHGYTNKENGQGNIQGNIMSINEINIPKEEFSMFFQDEKALTASYFSKEYGAEYSSTFWETKYGEEVPIERAKKSALDKLTKIKIEQQLAIEYGLLKSALFEDLEEIIKSQESIYGIENAEPFQAYMIYHSKLVLDTIQEFKLTAPSIAEEELKKLYEDEKMTLFKAPDDIKAIQISMEAIEEDRKEELFKNIKEDIQKGITMQQLEEKYKNSCTFSIKTKEYGRNESKEENGTELEVMLKEIVHKLEINQMTEPIEYRDNYYIMVCLEKKEGEIIPFETAKITIQDRLQEEAFDKEVQQRVEQAKIIINEPIYNVLKMQ